MPESNMHKIMAAFREWVTHQEEENEFSIPFEVCQCPAFGSEMEVE